MCVCVCKQEAFQSGFRFWYSGRPSLDFEQECPNVPSPHSPGGWRFGPSCCHSPQPTSPPYEPSPSQHLIGMLMTRDASICNSSLEIVFRFLCPVVEGGCREIFFFFPAPGQTGKINLALCDRRHTSPPWGLLWSEQKKQECGQVKILIAPFAEDQDAGQRPGSFHKLLFSVINFQPFVHTQGGAVSTPFLTTWEEVLLCLR